ncbi:MAG: transketolase C-terminal domain-containing protein, partial [Lachnospiraceae bacterium]
APDEEYTIQFGKATIRREGNDVTIVGTSLMVHHALSAAKKLWKKGISCEVIDLRTLVPLDEECIINSVCKTGRLVIASEDVSRCGVAAEIMAVVVENEIAALKAPIKRVCIDNMPIPFSPVCEREVVPSMKKIMDAVMDTMQGGEK